MNKKLRRVITTLRRLVRQLSAHDFSIHADGFTLPGAIKYFNYRFWFSFMVLAVALLLYPVLPALQFSGETQVLSEEERVAQLVQYEESLEQYVSQRELQRLPKAQDRNQGEATPHSLVIDKIGVNSQIVEGDNAHQALNQGIWRIPVTSTPDRGGNTVLTAHRYKFLPPSDKTFYLLDKLEVGDEAVVHWGGKQYTYEVTDTMVVTPDQVWVMANTRNPQLTLITCTPLFSNSHRLVVIFQLKDVVVE